MRQIENRLSRLERSQPRDQLPFEQVRWLCEVIAEDNGRLPEQVYAAGDWSQAAIEADWWAASESNE